MKVLPIDLIEIDAGTQSRLAINEDVVEEYAELIKASDGDWPFPHLEVFHDGNRHMLADGFHRVLAANKAKRVSAPCKLHKGTATDARIFAMTANDRHGLRMTRADKRNCVEWLLDNGGKMTQADIADKAGVSKRLVQLIVSERKEQKAQTSRPSGGSAKPPAAQSTSGTDPVSEEEAPESRGDGTESTEGPGEETPDEKCPNCAKVKWTDDGDGWYCEACGHPYGEPAPKPARGKQKVSAATLVDNVARQHFSGAGGLPQMLEGIAAANGGKGPNYEAAKGALDVFLAAMRKMREGAK